MIVWCGQERWICCRLNRFSFQLCYYVSKEKESSLSFSENSNIQSSFLLIVIVIVVTSGCIILKFWWILLIDEFRVG